MTRANRCMYMAHVCFYVCCSDSVGVCGNVCCVAAVVKDMIKEVGSSHSLKTHNIHHNIHIFDH